MSISTPNTSSVLLEAALDARFAVKEATKFRTWQEQGWALNDWQARQVMQLENGNLRKQMIAANKAYGHGVSADEGIIREQMLTIQIETDRFMANYLRQ